MNTKTVPFPTPDHPRPVDIRPEVAAASQPFPLLADMDHYTPCSLNLSTDAPMRHYWVGLFRRHFSTLLKEAESEAISRGFKTNYVKERGEEANREFLDYLQAVEQSPPSESPLNILELCHKRQQIIIEQDLADPYRLTKAKENRAALKLLPALLAELDALPDPQRAIRIILGVFAGNIFDLGVEATLELFNSGQLDFHRTLNQLKPRPWLIDHLDTWIKRITNGSVYRCAVLFVDNAGCDVVLGMIPFARDLLQRGSGVILTANTLPALNDITHEELVDLIHEVASMDSIVNKALKENFLELIPSGNGTPLIDLTQCSSELVDAVRRREADLVVLEGMGRSLESNAQARFTCDALKIAMVKDPGAARMINGQIYDLVLRYEPIQKSL